MFPIPDFSAPADAAAFWTFAKGLAEQIQEGAAVLIHCGAGIGRTGTMGVAVLMALQMTLEAALRNVDAAGSHPETAGQRAILKATHGN